MKEDRKSNKVLLNTKYALFKLFAFQSVNFVDSLNLILLGIYLGRNIAYSVFG